MPRMWTIRFAFVLGLAGAAVGACSSKSAGPPASDSPDTAGGADSSSTSTGPNPALLAGECFDVDAGLTETAAGMFSPSDFCTLYLATCTAMDNSYGDMSACLKGYAASANLPDGDQRHCRSAHICNAAVFDPADVVLHCGHAAGIVLCN